MRISHLSVARLDLTARLPFQGGRFNHLPQAQFGLVIANIRKSLHLFIVFKHDSEEFVRFFDCIDASSLVSTELCNASLL